MGTRSKAVLTMLAALTVVDAVAYGGLYRHRASDQIMSTAARLTSFGQSLADGRGA